MTSSLRSLRCVQSLGRPAPQAWRGLHTSPTASGPPDSTPKADSLQPARRDELTHYRITLLRTPLGLPKEFGDTARALGLTKRMAVRYHRHSPDNAGAILKIKELVKVENVTTREMLEGKKSSRSLVGENRGYRVLRNVLDDRVREREITMGLRGTSDVVDAAEMPPPSRH